MGVLAALEVFAGGGEDELAELDAAEGEHAVGEVLEGRAAAFHDDHLEAVVVVEVDVGGSEDHGAGGVLDLGEFLGEVWDVMVVDEGECADDGLVGGDVVGEEGFADEVTDGLGAVFVAAAGDELVELFEEIFVERNAGAAELGHGGVSKGNCIECGKSQSER